VEFRILGPLQARAAGRELRLGGLRSQRILAMLLLNPNRVVTVASLVEAAWDDTPPATARRQVQNRVATLRTLLLRAGATIETHQAGYLLRVAPDELDALRFGRLVERARQTPDPGQAARWLREALALWRGPALAGLGGVLLDREAAGLEERRVATLVACLELELRAGEHARLVPELSRLVAEHPLRERFVAQWMLALYRTGRRGEALEAFQRLRRRLVDELGVEPGPELQELHRTVLGGEGAALAATLPAIGGTGEGGRAVPRQLPADVPTFTGREVELARLTTDLARTGHGGPVVISAIHGPGGVGKSALAIHAAHRLADRFPDGQLYGDLQGAAAGLRPLPALEVLGRFLRALGVPGERIPAEVQEAAALFRSELAPRRVLVVLDNARDAAQVAPLVPGTAGCALLVTSRRTLTDLDGARSVQLDVLSTEEAVRLLARLAGPARIAAERTAAVEVARWCGRLPLALRIAGARLAARPGWPVRALADRLADTQRRLNELELGDVGVRASLAVSREELRDSREPVDRAAADAIAMLSTIDGPDLGVPVAACLLDQAEPLAERVLERLADANLLETSCPGRYRLHDLLRLYGRELAGRTSSPAEQAGALTRAFGFYLATAWQTLGLLRPGDYRLARADPRWTGGGLAFADTAAALDWLEAERANLVAAVQQIAGTADGVPPALAVQLAQALFGFFRVRGYWTEAAQVNEVALEVAVARGDRAAEAAVRIDLGAAWGQLERYPQARACLAEAIAGHRELGDRPGLAAGLVNLGVVYQSMACYEQALDCYQESLSINEELGNLRGQAMSLSNLATIQRRKERYQQALSYHQRSLAIYQKLGDRYAQAVGLVNLGVLYEMMGRYDDALSCLEESRAIYREMGDRYGESETLTDLGVLYGKQGRYEQALAYQQQALATCRELGRQEGQAVSLQELGHTLRALGRPDEARACWQEALAIFERLSVAHADEVRALLAGEPPAGPGPQR
jgi:DNA-binding SARP family transcriptional activator/tetratricopeptide (TPR) repeat protein